VQAVKKLFIVCWKSSGLFEYAINRASAFRPHFNAQSIAPS